MYLLILLTILLIFIPLSYWYLTRNHNYWSKLGVKGPKPIPLFGNIHELFIRPQAVTQLKWFTTYGKVFGYYFGNSPVVVVSEPEIIKNILVKDFKNFMNRTKERLIHMIPEQNLGDAQGDDWKRIRSIVSPTFSSGKIKRMYPMVKECVDDLINVLDIHAEGDMKIDARSLFSKFTMDVLCTCAFAAKTNVQNDSKHPIIHNIKNIIDNNIVRIILMLLLPQWMITFFRISSIPKSVQFFRQITEQIIEKRRNGANSYRDFIQLLIDAKIDTESTHEDNVVEPNYLIENSEKLETNTNIPNLSRTKRILSEDEIFAQAMIFFLAGYDATATALTFASYELAVNPIIQERLYSEVNSAIDCNGDISYEVLTGLPYLDAVLSENLRLHSPAVMHLRVGSEDYELGGTGVKVLKGQQIEIPVYSMHRSEDFYEKPLEFRPERFLRENRHKIIPYTFLPFGVGPRKCIGMRFALLEAKLTLALFVNRFQLYKCSQTDIPLKYKRNIFSFSNMPDKVILGIKKRQIVSKQQ